MRTLTIEKTVYKLDELSEKARERAISKQAEFASEVFEPDFIYEDAENVANILGIEFDQRAVKLMNGSYRYEALIEWTGFWSQGDGARFSGSYSYKKGAAKLIREYASQDKTLHEIADDLEKAQRKYFYSLEASIKFGSSYYSHANTMQIEVYDKRDEYREIDKDASKTIEQAMRDFANWIYSQLEKQYEWETGEESCVESIEINEYEFDEDGNIA